MRIVRSTVLRLLSARQARLVLGASPRELTGLSLDALRRRAEEARALHARYAEVAARDQALARRSADVAKRQVAVDTQKKADLFGEAAQRYDRAIARREDMLRGARGQAATLPRGVAVLSLTGERAAPGVTSGREVRVRKAPARKSRRSRRG